MRHASWRPWRAQPCIFSHILSQATHPHAFPSSAADASAAWRALRVSFPDISPPEATTFSPHHEQLFFNAARHVRRSLHARRAQQLLALKHSARERAHYHSISSRPASMWLETLPVAPPLHLSDQAFKDNARIRLGVKAFTTTHEPWLCTCGQRITDDDVAHALSCSKLAGLVQGRHDDT